MTGDLQGNMVLNLQSTDACHRTASLSWSAYANLSGGIDHYEVLYSSDQGQSWSLAGTTISTSYTIENLQFNTNYLAFARVVNNDGTVTASTNRVSFQISSEEAEDFT